MKYLNIQSLVDIVSVIVGILFCGFALKGFLIPNQFFDGGVTGISLLIHEITHWNVGLLILLVNIPFILLGKVLVNKEFATKTFIAVIGLAVCIYFVPYPQITSDKLLVSIFGGAFMGCGIAFAVRGGCALDGIEVLALYTIKKISFTISEIILGINIVIFLVAALKLGLTTALYSILTYYVASRVCNFVVEGIEEFTSVTIISASSDAIKRKLVLDLGKGITVYKGKRGFQKEDFEKSYNVEIIHTIVTRLDLVALNKAVYEIDPKAFIFTEIIKDAKGGILKRQSGH